jgi:hypothetical protein
MVWDWSRIVELTGLVVTIITLHMSNLRFNQRTRDDLTTRLAKMETKVDLVYGWLKRRVLFRGKANESDDEG